MNNRLAFCDCISYDELTQTHLVTAMDIDEPIYTVAQVAKAMNVPVATLRSYLQRGQIKLLEGDKPAEINGTAHKVSLRSALHIGVFLSLVRHFVPASKANEAAWYWLHFGGEGRDPAELYSAPWTILCVYPDAMPEIVHSPLKEGKAFNLFVPAQGGQDGGVFIILDHVDRRIRTALEEKIDA